ncbi:MAG: hypothetical protein EWV61_17630 [Microcystis aeruginosa Ma_AC_P_19900807_S300]|nr:MAG: hypothetical protein EWV61_17630 [Microcystis aeruginosa Ma_AC_P_19900807_S300]
MLAFRIKETGVSESGVSESGDRRLFYLFFPLPHTPHPTPHTLHPTPHTPHPTPYTPHPTPHFPIPFKQDLVLSLKGSFLLTD